MPQSWNCREGSLATSEVAELGSQFWWIQLVFIALNNFSNCFYFCSSLIHSFKTIPPTSFHLAHTWCWSSISTHNFSMCFGLCIWLTFTSPFSKRLIVKLLIWCQDISQLAPWMIYHHMPSLSKHLQEASAAIFSYMFCWISNPWWHMAKIFTKPVVSHFANRFSDLKDPSTRWTRLHMWIRGVSKNAEWQF